jgi:hypothetical protein
MVDRLDPSSEILSGMLARLTACGAPVYKRIEDNETFYRVVRKFRTRFAKARQFVNRERKTCDRTHLPELLRFGTVIDKLEGWFNATVQGNMDTIPSEPLPVKPGLFVQHFAEFRREFNVIKGYIQSPKVPIRSPDPASIADPLLRDL